VQTITSSVIYSSGSNTFGDEQSDIQQFTGSVDITGSLTVNGRNYLTDSASFDTRIGYVSSSFNAHTASINAFSSSVLNFTASTLVNSASFDTRINYVSSSFEAATASLNLFSASVLSYTASNNEVVAKLYAETSSLLANTASMNLFSSSMLSFTASTLVNSASFDTRINNLSSSFEANTASFNAFSASMNANTASMNAFSASVLSFTASTLVNSASFDTRINYVSSSFEAATASLNAFSASVLAYTASNDITIQALYAETASLEAATASLNLFSASMNATTASMNAFSASVLNYTASQNDRNGTYATTGSNTFYGVETVSGSVLVSGSIALQGDQNIVGNLTVTDTITAQKLIVQTITSSVIYSSGSNIFGDATSDTQTFTGSVNISGSLNLVGDQNINAGYELDVDTINVNTITDRSGGTLTLGASTSSVSGFLTVNNNISASGRIEASSFTGSFSGSINNFQGTATHIPYFSSSQVLADSAMYQVSSASIAINQDNVTTAAPEALYVWQPSTTSYNVISGKGNLDNYLQLNIQNTNQGVSASSDVVATANNGDENSNYINMGINGENFNGPIGEGNDAYLYSTGNNLHIGNTKAGKHLGFFVGGDNAETDKKLQLNPTGHHQMTGSLDINLQVTASRFVTRGATAADFVKGDGSLDNTLYTSASVFNNTTSSLQAFSASMLSFTASTLVNSASFDTRIKYLSSSFEANTASFNAYSASMNAFSASILSTTASINSFSSSVLNFTASTLVNSASFDTRIKYISSSFEAATASLNAFSSSMLNFTASQKNSNGTFATTGSNIFKGNQTITGSLSVSGSTNIYGTTNVTGSVNVSGSTGTAITANVDTIVFTGSYAQSGSVSIQGTQTITGSLIVSNTITAERLIVQYISSSVIYSSGSNKFGDEQSDVQQFTGSVDITGSLVVNGRNYITDSGSFDKRINYISSSFEAATASLNLFSASMLSTTASLNAFSSSVLSFTASALVDSASFDTRINYVSSSFEAATASLNLFSASMLSTTASVNAFSASMLSFTASTLVNSASFDTRIGYISSSFEAATASLNLFSASVLSYTASNNEVVAKLYAETSSLLANTASMNLFSASILSYTSSNNEFVADMLTETASLQAATASLNANTASMNLFSASMLNFTASTLVNSASFDTRINYLSSSFEANTASLNSFTASFNAFSSSILNTTASVNAFSASMLSFTASQKNLNGTFATTGSNTFIGNQVISGSTSMTGSLSLTGSQNIIGNLTVTDTITAQRLVVQFITSSVIQVTGSTKFGDEVTDTHQFTGSVLVSGSLVVNGRDYITDSGSFDTRINYISSSFEAATASLNLFSASILSYTASNNEFVADILTETASLQAATASLNLFSASVLSFTASTLVNSASFDTRINYVSSSFEAATSSFNNFSSSILSTTASINAFSASVLAYTASNDITISAIYAETASLQAATASLNLFSASMLSFTASQKNLNGTFAITGSNTFYGTETISGSLLVSGSTNLTNLTASGLRYPTTDGLEGQTVQTDGAGNLFFNDIETIYEPIRNGEAFTLVKGTPVYVSGSQGANPIVYAADAAIPAKMPVTYIIDEDILSNEVGRGILLGLITGINLTGYTAGAEVYVAAGGGWTSTRPTGSAIIQVLGIITKPGNGGQGLVLNPGPANLPNIQTGYTWVGNSNGYPIAIATSSIQNVISASYAGFAETIASGLNITASNLSVTNNANIGGNLVVNGTASFNYVETISGSAVIIGQEYIILNTQSPAARFAGLKIYDSGSTSATASIVWDSERNHLVYQNASGSSYAGGGFMSGPRNTGSLGDETYPTFNRVLRGQGGDHLYNSNIFDDDNLIRLEINTAVTGTLNVTNGITGSLLGNVVGDITGNVTGNVTGNLIGTASYASNADLLDGLDSTQFVLTSSFQNYSASMQAFSASVLNYTASNNATITKLYAETASILNYTASNNVTIQAIYAETASILAHTASINAFSASINAYTSSNNDAITSLYSATASLNLATASLYAATASIYNTTASLSSSIAILSGSFLSASSSFDTRINSLTESVFTHVVTNNGASNYIIDGVTKPVLSFVPGATYKFDTTAVGGSHPFRFSTSPNGPTQYTTGVTSGSNYIQIEVNYDTPTPLYYYCTIHSGMGNEINVLRIENLVTTASFSNFSSSINAFSASILNYTSSVNGTISAIYAETASIQAFSASMLNFTASQKNSNGTFATTGSNVFEGVQTINSNLIVTGSITAQTLVVQTITSSVDFVTGSTHFGTILENTHQFTGSVSVSGSLAVNDSNVILTNQTASMSVATASYWSGSILNSTSASFASTASYWSGSINNVLSASYALTASHATNVPETASFANNATSASYALTASFALNVPETASFALTASYWSGSIINAQTASYVVLAQSASYWSGSIQNAVSAAFADLATSASFASTASFALNGGGGGLSALYIQDEGITQGTASYIDFTGAGVTATVTNGTASISITGGGSGTAVQGASVQFSQPTASTTWSINHAINSRTPVVEVYDNDYNVIIPTGIQNPAPYQTNIFFEIAQSGYAVISTGGVLSVSGSNAILNQNVSSSTWTFNHELNNLYPVFTIFDSNDDVIIPQRIHVVDTGSAVIYFSSPRTGTAVASVAGNQTFALSSSLAATASLALTAISSSYAATASFVTTAQTASFVQIAQTASYWSGSIDNVLSASYAATASHADNFTVAGTLTAQTLVIQTITSSVIYSSGSNVFGNDLSNTQVLTGSVSITGSLAVNGSNAVLTDQTASMSVATASFASTASFTPNAFVSVSIDIPSYDTIKFSFGDETTTSVTVNNVASASYAATASYWSGSIINAETASFVTLAQTASFVTTAQTASYWSGSIQNAVSAAFADLATSSSYAATASFALNGGGGGISAISIADEGILLGSASYFDFTGAGVSTIVNAGTASFTISGGGSGTQGLTTTFTQSSAAVSWSFTHNLNTRTPVVQVYDSGYNQITPQYISSSDASTVVIGFGIPTTGYAVISTGGALVVTGSNVILNQTASATTWSFNHGLNQQYPIFQVFNTDDEVIIPERIKAVDSASALIYFPTPVAGKAVASFAGLSGSIGGGSGAGFPFSGSAVITGSFLVSGSFVDFTQVGSFTGNLTGTASYATFALTASTAPGYTVQFSQTASAATWSFTHNMGTRNPIVQVYGSDYKQLIPNDIVGIDGSTVEVRFDYATTGYAILSNGGGLYITGSTSTLIQTSAAATWSFNHQLNTKYPAFEIYDENDLVIIPAGIKAIDTDNAEIYFAGAQAGRAIANFSGINGLQDNAVSASYASSGSVFHVDKVVMDRSLMDYAQVNSSIVGSNNMFTQATGSYTSMFVNYTVASGSNARSGQIIAVWNAGTTEYNDVSTTDIGNTSAVTGSVSIVTGEAQLNFQTNTSGWRIKSTATFM
jgi:hypothetical protein